MNYYEKWLKAEKEWIDTYCKKTRNMTLFVVTPFVLVVLTALFGALELANGSETSAVIESAAGGLMMGIFICFIYLLIMLPNLNPGKYSKKIDQNVKQLGLTDAEKEQLGQEMLAADQRHRISYTMVGPKSKGTPARFVLTPHYAFLEGSSPYSILVRMSDIAEIRPSQEQKNTVTYGTQTKTYYNFTLYTIGFYRKDRAERGRADQPYPDEGMGFFQEDIRNEALKLLMETDVPVKTS